ncbi:MBL fold metallo-hydrolase RNA specificity domain-containing protein [Marinobacterium stanieri]|uniref:Metallo-beta-lactamase family protein n=1 Tax=Marinobacterium stanieri TaxID=49186 RepID=A0A1N6SCA4_9GAMM|nr:MBL fold metallo-hydrolase [Marinobacterium stanieri]SIQ38785.1 metallo-beta-lactamase family protein [Marinobacterium stanieri]
MPYLSIEHHGAEDGVTGSCHQLRIDENLSVLVDCGLFQGDETDPSLHPQHLGFSVEGVLALIVTHVHIDHVGRIPGLLAAGFRGPIICSQPSAHLLPLVLEDAFKLGISRDSRHVEPYLAMVNDLIIAVPYKQWFSLINQPDCDLKLRLQRAGHILGSAYVELDLTHKGKNKRIVFSGDLGSSNTPLLPPPVSPEKADILVLESTYGDRVHENRETRIERLKSAIDRALQNKGTVLIPAFSIGRTQELLYELEELLEMGWSAAPDHSGNGGEKRSINDDAGCGICETEDRRGESSGNELCGTNSDEDNTCGINVCECCSCEDSACGSDACGSALRARISKSPNLKDSLPTQIPVILDSPLASRFTKAYRDMKPFWDEEAQERLDQGRRPLAFDQLLTIDSHHDHLKMVKHLSTSGRPAIVIAGSGMCNAGRIVNYLKAMLPDPRHDVLFVGYQAEGTPGRDIQRYGPTSGYVWLDDEKIDIRAGVETIGGYSAHADQDDLVSFFEGIEVAPEEIRLVHGDKKAIQGLKKRLLLVNEELAVR